ncbi:MAG: 4-(cytidine 5'-diphospho)-2-C-methyl-D-erythritol kinase [Edaphocola sp.]
MRATAQEVGKSGMPPKGYLLFPLFDVSFARQYTACAMLRFPNAKINIGLFVTEKRQDGYHNLETIFYPVMLRDALEIIPNIAAPGDDMDFHSFGLPIPGDTKSNLVTKAYRLLKNDFGATMASAGAWLYKHIPMGGGMGGGSADGAFALGMLNELFALGLEEYQLLQYALQLGSDCPFFIHNKPMYGSGRGEVLEAATIDLSGYDVLLICPNIHVSTAEAFGGIKPKPAPYDLRELHKLPVAEWHNVVRNDFEETVFQKHPELYAIKEKLYAKGAIYAAMSGTGATVYSIFEKGKAAAAKELGHDFFIV